MTWTMAFFTFLNAWFIALLLAFPFSIEPPDQDDEKWGYNAAPKRIKWRKLLISGIIMALIFTLLLAMIIKSGIVPVKHIDPL